MNKLKELLLIVVISVVVTIGTKYWIDYVRGSYEEYMYRIMDIQ